MDCFIRNLLRDKLLSVEENNFNNEEFVDIIEDGNSDRWSISVLNDDTISGINGRKKLVAATIPAFNAVIGTDAFSTILHHRPHSLFVSDDDTVSSIDSKEKLVAATIPALNAVIGTDAFSTILNQRPQRRLSVALVSDNARCFAKNRPEVFHRMEGNKTQIDRWDANHSTHSDSNRSHIRRAMSDSRLVIPNRSWKQQYEPFRQEKRDTMLVMPKRSRKQQHVVIASKIKEEDEGPINDSDDDQYKHNDSIVMITSKIISESLRVVSWNDKTNNHKTNNRGTKRNMFVLKHAIGDLAPIPITRSGDYRKKETTSRTA